jgi:ribose transport system ATP-binding protein
VGENGAGKSTLIKILGGAYQPDRGAISIEGRPVRIGSPSEARRLGIAVIHQELTLVPELSVAENIFLPALPATAAGLLDRATMAREAAALMTRLGSPVSPWTAVRRLPLGQQQLVEIARALSARSRLVVMDEPTAALTEAESERLFAIIAELKAAGTAVVYISHRMSEVFRLADYIEILRDGEHAGSLTRGEATPAEVVRRMVGREVSDHFPKQVVPHGEELLSVTDLASPGKLAGITFALRRGETLGVGGLAGAGQYDLARALFGLLHPVTGHLRVKGAEVKLASPRSAMAAGVGLLPENRKEDGLVLAASVAHNLELASLRALSRRGGWIDRHRERSLVATQMQQLAIRATGPGQLARNLSGGNQQKVVLGKWLATQPEVIVLCEPTRGIDVGAKVEIYRLMGQLAAAGKGLILISSELPELLALSDRVLVMVEGRPAGVLTREEATPERVMHLATGGNTDDH